ncbi:MBL fold metallo-hydrolase [Emticicia sp. C21]|uniref:MBL fold metallo-hydrolase n=1 Tax=Emticicia sp. C21 TaxID=2302915 RepID=UPI000E350DF0|nr:MBL fold metallo-hydrolase [Emticicia sp. C21]RFS18575.1 MBL fold metallo-hydrolase [Emticicia sp. C21]
MEQSKDNKMIPMTSVDSGKLREVAPDVAYFTNQIVNLIMIGKPDSSWVLVDAGMPQSGEEIIEAVELRYGKNNPPSAIILTHGHFDHVGSIVYLLSKWRVPVYAHLLEFPFLTGQQAYPEPDTSVEGGLIAKISFLFPHEPINIQEALQSLPANGKVPQLPDWQWIHVPGHSPGQIALFRKEDGLLISADAFVTVKQDSLYKVLTQEEEVSGPPVYLTTDWAAAYQSVKRLAQLNPETVISGHGTAMQSEELKRGLDELIAHWDEVALPEHGKWVKA